MNNPNIATFDTIIIGAGQCGLFAAKKLQDIGLNYLLLERNTVGQVWDERLEGMRLFTSRQLCHLPGLAFPGEQNGFPDISEMANYLCNYIETFKLNIRERTKVINLTKNANQFLIALENGELLSAKTVINATGSNQVAYVPEISTKLSDQVLQYDALLPSLSVIPSGKSVVVVGDGATGRQIAGGLAKRCQVTLATGVPRGMPPNTILGKDLFWWLKKTGILYANKNSLVANILKNRNPVPLAKHNNKNLKKLGVTIQGRALDCSKQRIFFANDYQDNVDIVIWAIGYRENTQWLELPNCIDNKEIIHECGITPEPGFYVIGRKWLSCRASELVMGVEKDVTYVIKQLKEQFFQSKELR